MKKNKKPFIGYEIIRNRSIMTGSMMFAIFKVVCLLHILIFAALSYYFFGSDLYYGWKYIEAVMIADLPFGRHMINVYIDGRLESISCAVYISAIKPFISGYLRHLALLFFGAMVVIYGIGYYLGVRLFAKKAEKEMTQKHQRGTQLTSVKGIRDELDKCGECTYLPIGEVRQPVSLENLNTLFLFKAGGGKTQSIRPRLAALKKRGTKTVVYCYDPHDLFCPMYDPKKDIVFQPLDARCCGWNIFNEVNNEHQVQAEADINAIAQSLIPTPADAGQNSWCYDDSRDVYAAIMLYLWIKNERTNKALYRMICLAQSNPNEFLNNLKNTYGCEKGYALLTNPKTASNIFGCLMQHCKAFRYMADLDGDFSTRKWMQAEDGSSLFILNAAQYKDTIRAVLTLFIDLLIRRLDEMDINLKRRRYFIIDELATLNRLDSIIVLLTQTRRKGGGADVGFQSLPLLESLYGRQAEHILGQFGTKVFGVVGDNATSEYMSRNIGKSEVIEKTESMGYGLTDIGDRGGLQDHHGVRSAVMAEEIRQMPKLNAYVHFAGYKWFLTTIPVCDIPPKHEAFLMRNIDLKSVTISSDDEELNIFE